MFNKYVSRTACSCPHAGAGALHPHGLRAGWAVRRVNKQSGCRSDGVKTLAAMGGSPTSLKFQGELFRECMDWKTKRLKKSYLDAGGARKGWEKSILSGQRKSREHLHI